MDQHEGLDRLLINVAKTDLFDLLETQTINMLSPLEIELYSLLLKEQENEAGV